MPWSHSGSGCCWVWGSSCLMRGPERVGVPKHPTGAVFGVRPASPHQGLGCTGDREPREGDRTCGIAHEQCWGNGRLVGDGTRESRGENKVICGILQGFLYIQPQCWRVRAEMGPLGATRVGAAALQAPLSPCSSAKHSVCSSILSSLISRLFLPPSSSVRQNAIDPPAVCCVWWERDGSCH